MSDTLLVRYGELALKSPPVRREFENRLKHNILEGFLRDKRSCTLSADHGHLYVHTSAAETALPIVRRVFGVVSVSAAEVVPSEPPRIQEALVRMADPWLRPGTRFAIRARRTGSHAFTSQALAADLGGAVLERYADRALKVDLTTPAVELYVEVRGPKTYLYVDRVEGPGGLPLGVGGKVGALVDGERGALGAYLLMKRGCRVYPSVVGEGRALVDAVLSRFDPGLRPVEVASAQAGWDHLLGRAQEKGWDGVILPLDIDDYARAREFFGETVIFSPTVGLDDQEVHRRWSAAAALVQ